MNKLIIFDLDGTLLDTSEGIINSYFHIIKEFNLYPHDRKTIRKFIGQNLLRSIMDNFEVEEIVARRVIVEYRKRYAEKGIFEFSEYSGLRETLQSLIICGHKLAIATLKNKELAQTIFDNLGLSHYFETIRGMDAVDSLSKSEIINQCIEDCNHYDLKEIIMIGDSWGDYNAAVESNVAFVGVDYGYGFSKSVKYEFPIISSLSEIKLLY